MRQCLLYLIIAAQLFWLGWHYIACTLEVKTGPRLKIACQVDSLYDFFREDYLAIKLRRNIPLLSPKVGNTFWWDAKAVESLNNIERENRYRSPHEKIQELVPFPEKRKQDTHAIKLDHPDFTVGRTVATFWKIDKDGFTELERIAPLTLATTLHVQENIDY